MGKGSEVKYIEQRIEDLVKIITYLRESIEVKQGELDAYSVAKFRTEENLAVGDLVKLDGHKGKISGFKVTKEGVKPLVLKYKKNTDGSYKESTYGTSITVQSKHTLEVL